MKVCESAGTFARELQSNSPQCNITDKDILCVQIAALCYSLGHGPFSYLYFNRLLEADDLTVKSDLESDCSKLKNVWKMKEIADLATERGLSVDDLKQFLEDRAKERFYCEALDDILKHANVSDKLIKTKADVAFMQDLIQDQLIGHIQEPTDASCAILKEMWISEKMKEKVKNAELTDDDLKFIQALIRGKAEEGLQPPEKNFLYEIVNNQYNGIDVKLWDYLEHDFKTLGETSKNHEWNPDFK
eukprot:Em0001g1837a